MEGRQYSMAGVIDADADYRGKLVRFGYVELTEKESCFLPEKEGIQGHEFHYFVFRQFPEAVNLQGLFYLFFINVIISHRFLL